MAPGRRLFLASKHPGDPAYGKFGQRKFPFRRDIGYDVTGQNEKDHDRAVAHLIGHSHYAIGEYWIGEMGNQNEKRGHDTQDVQVYRKLLVHRVDTVNETGNIPVTSEVPQRRVTGPVMIV